MQLQMHDNDNDDNKAEHLLEITVILVRENPSTIFLSCTIQSIPNTYNHTFLENQGKDAAFQSTNSFDVGLQTDAINGTSIVHIICFRFKCSGIFSAAAAQH